MSPQQQQTSCDVFMKHMTRSSSLARTGRIVVALQVAVVAVVLMLGVDGRTAILCGVIVLLSAIGVIAMQRRARRAVSALSQRLSENLDDVAASPLDENCVLMELQPLAVALWQQQRDVAQRLELLQARLDEQQIIHRSMSVGIIALDPDLRILSINPAGERLLGMSDGASTGRLLRDLVHEPELSRLLTQALRDRTACEGEFAMIGRSGVALHALAEPLRNAHEHAVGVLVLLTDVTRVRKLERLRSDFAANVSHELRTPITNIQGYVETLLEVGCDDSDQTRRFLLIIQRNAERLGSIIEDLLSLARLEQPDMMEMIERIDVPVRALFETAMQDVEQARGEKDIRITMNVDPALQANVNAPLMGQALCNLLSNAIKYSPANTTVTLAAHVNDRHEIEISVTDQGPGIAREHLPRLFERFYRIDRARSRALGGTGLGLAIVKHVALVHGGRVNVASAIGEGSTFRIVLPQGRHDVEEKPDEARARSSLNLNIGRS